MSASSTVVLFQYRLFHYRVSLFERLRELLNQRGIRLELVYGQPFGREKLKRDEGHVAWGRRVRNLYFPVKEKKDLCWQPLPAGIARPDLVIFMQENRLLANYYWMLRSRLGPVRTAFWGHGRNFQAQTPTGLRERWRRAMIHAVDWWFAYTQITLDVLRDVGYPDDRVTLLNNSIDTQGFAADAAGVAPARLDALRAELGLPDGASVGLFCGSIYPDKKPELLIAAADHVRRSAPDFHLIVIGDGQSAPYVREACRTRPWCHWVGARRGIEKAEYFRLADFVLNPGAVGLHVLDAFALGLPMITTRTALHGPEIAYLEDGKTGFTTGDSAEEYGNIVLRLIEDRALAESMREQALAAGREHTVERMAERFADGIVDCLAAPARRGRR